MAERGGAEEDRKAWMAKVEWQRQQIHQQIEDLQRLVTVQCRMTGTNPLADEMASAVLGSRAGRRFGELTPKASKFLYDVFSIKDTITKKEAREISAVCGASVSQVREFFGIQRSRVRRLLHQPLEFPVSSDSQQLREDERKLESEKLSCQVQPSNRVKIEKGSEGFVEQPLNPARGINLKDSNCEEIAETLVSLMEKERTFIGQLNLADVILQTQSRSTLHGFVNKGGVQLIGKWLANAASEEQTGLLRLLMKALFHLPLGFALPRHMSALLYTINKLRFYRVQDIASRAWLLLSKWSKFFRSSGGGRTFPHAGSSVVLNQNMQKRNRDVNDMQKDSISTTKKPKTDLQDNSSKKLELITSSSSLEKESNKLVDGKLCSLNGVKKRPAQSLLSNDPTGVKERRKVRLFEEASSVLRRGNVADKNRVGPSTTSRPVCTDDIKKAKRKALLLQSFRAANRPEFACEQSRADLHATKEELQMLCVADERSLVSNGILENEALPEKSKGLEAETMQNISLTSLDSVPISMEKNVLSSLMPFSNFSTYAFPSNTARMEVAGGIKHGAEPSEESWIDIGRGSSNADAEDGHNNSSGNHPAECKDLLSTVGNGKSDATSGLSTLNSSKYDITLHQSSPAEAPPFTSLQTIPWCIPPGVALDPRWRVAAGEESTEKHLNMNQMNADEEISYSSNPEEPLEKVSLFEDESNVPEILLEAVMDDSQEIDDNENDIDDNCLTSLEASETKSSIPSAELSAYSMICPIQTNMLGNVSLSPSRETESVQSVSTHAPVEITCSGIVHMRSKSNPRHTLEAKLNALQVEDQAIQISLPETHNNEGIKPSNCLDEATRVLPILSQSLQRPSEYLDSSIVSQKQSSSLLSCSAVDTSNKSFKFFESDKGKTSGITPSVIPVQALRKDLAHVNSTSSLPNDYRSSSSTPDSSTNFSTEISRPKDEDKLSIDVSKLSKDQCWEMLKVVLQQLADSTGLGADVELLAVLLKNPDLVNVLITGQAPPIAEGLAALSEFLTGKFPNLNTSELERQGRAPFISSQAMAPAQSNAQPLTGSIPLDKLVEATGQSLLVGSNDAISFREASKLDQIPSQSYCPVGSHPSSGIGGSNQSAQRVSSAAMHHSFVTNLISAKGPIFEPPTQGHQCTARPPQHMFSVGGSGVHEMLPFPRPLPIYQNAMNIYPDKVMLPNSRNNNQMLGSGSSQGGNWMHLPDAPQPPAMPFTAGTSERVQTWIPDIRGHVKWLPPSQPEFVSRPPFRPPLPPGTPPPPPPLRSLIPPDMASQHTHIRPDARPLWKG